MHGEVEIPLTPTDRPGDEKLMGEGNKDPEDPTKKPGADAGIWGKFKWAITLPLYTITRFTIPGIVAESICDNIKLLLPLKRTLIP